MVQVSGNGDFETQIQKLFNQLRQQSTDSINNYDNFVAALPTKEEDYTYSNILEDHGDGRISAGMKSLELLSIMCSGTAPGNLFLFDNVVVTGSVNEFKTGSDKQLTNLVIANLGMEIVISGLSTEATASYRNQCLKIAKEVKTGFFDIDAHGKYILRESRRLTKLYLREQQ